MQDFSLGWASTSAGPRSDIAYNDSSLGWRRNPDYFAQWCGDAPAPGAPLIARTNCPGSTQMSANMRMRLQPELHPTEFITIHSQIDVLDNLILGSTPEGYYVPGRSTWVPLAVFASNQIPPIFGYNGFTNSIVVKRAWAEITNPSLGQLRFGRMPSHWGLGILANQGNGYDSDYQSTADRIMYAMRIRRTGIFASLAWDFPSVGPTSQNVIDETGQGQPYNLGMADDVNQVLVALGRRADPARARAAMARGQVVLNGGVYFVYRWQGLSSESNSSTVNPVTVCSSGASCGANMAFRNANAAIPDAWLQLLGRDFRIELEAVYIRGGFRSLQLAGGMNENIDYTISQFSGALEAEYRALNNRLALEFRSGYASGDPEMEGLTYSNGLKPQIGGNQVFSLARFHPDYRVDLIFWRSIMRQFAGAYYMRPSVTYNFVDDPGGDLLFGRVDVIWSRASAFQQTRGNHADLGVEIDATLQYQSNHRRPDSLDTRVAPGFYFNVQGGVFFPMAGLGPTDVELATSSFRGFNLATAFTVRSYLGVMF